MLQIGNQLICDSRRVTHGKIRFCCDLRQLLLFYQSPSQFLHIFDVSILFVVQMIWSRAYLMKVILDQQVVCIVMIIFVFHVNCIPFICRYASNIFHITNLNTYTVYDQYKHLRQYFNISIWLKILMQTIFGGFWVNDTQFYRLFTLSLQQFIWQAFPCQFTSLLVSICIST